MMSWELSPETIQFDPNDTSTMLGRGGFGSVFRGTCQGQTVAVKRFDQIHHADSAEFDAAIAKEIQGWKEISHEPNILTLLGVCTKVPAPIIVTELYQTSIRRYVRDWPDMLLSMVYQFAKGLVSIHNANMIHRDIKGDNILVRFQKTVAIAGFELCCRVQDMIAEDRPCGTLNWMSPEQYLRPRSVTPKSDIWSFGMTLWEILSDNIPYRCCSEHEFAQEIFQSEDDRPEKPDNLNPELEPLWTLITKCWQLNPDARPSAVEIVDFLETNYSSHVKSL